MVKEKQFYHNALYKNWNKLFLGIFIYELGGILYEFIFIENFIGRLISLAGILIAFLHIIKIPKINPLTKNHFITFIFCLYLCFNIITIIRGLLHSNMGGILIDPKYFWQYVLPFIIFLKLPPKIFTLLYQWSFIYIITALLFCLYNFSDFYLNASEIMKSMVGWDGYIVNRPQTPCMLSLPICLFLFNWKDLKKTHKIIICTTFILAISAALFAGRRSAAASILFFIFIAFAIKIKQHLGKVIIALIVLYFIPLNLSKIIPDLSETFTVLSERLDSNTRENVEEDFYKDFKKTSEWMVGRGMDGTYRSPSVANITDLNRKGIETGYLNIILHGGLLLLIPYLIILIFSTNKIRKRKELVCNNKSAAIFIFFHLLWLYPGGTPKLGLEFFILWILISITLSRNSFYKKKVKYPKPELN